MCRYLTAAILVVLLSVFAHQQAPAAILSSSTVESEIKQTIRERLAALQNRDTKAYLSFYAEDPLVTSDGGALLKPDAVAREWTDAPRLGITYKGSDVLDLRVQAFAEFAVANFRLDLDEDWGGQKLFGAVRITDVFVHRARRWLLVSHQETPLPNARRVAAKVDTALLDAYAGEYRITPSFLVKVKREGDKLFDLWPGESEFTEEIPVSSTTFVARGDSGEVIYEEGPGGKVTHFIFRTPSGDLIAEKTQ